MYKYEASFFHRVPLITISVALHSSIILVSSAVNGVGDFPAFVGAGIQVILVPLTMEHGPPHFAGPLVFIGVVVGIPCTKTEHSTENLCIPLVPVAITDRAPFVMYVNLHTSISKIATFHSVAYACKDENFFLYIHWFCLQHFFTCKNIIPCYYEYYQDTCIEYFWLDLLLESWIF